MLSSSVLRRGAAVRLTRAALCLALGAPSVAAAQPRVAPVSLRTVSASVGLPAVSAVRRAPAPCALRKGAWWKHPVLATGALATPVAVIGALAADQHRGRVAAGAMAGGAAYAIGATVYWSASPCEKVDGLMYVWTPVAAIVGAVIAAR